MRRGEEIRKTQGEGKKRAGGRRERKEIKELKERIKGMREIK